MSRPADQRDGPAAPLAAAAAAAGGDPPVAAAAALPSAVEPDDPTVPCWNRLVLGFGPFFHQVVRAGRPETTLELPNFTLLGHVWHVDLYPLRPGGTCGVFLKYIDKAAGNNSDQLPSVAFRIVAFHRDVVAETDRLNAPILQQRQEEAQRTAAGEAEENGQPVCLPSAAVVDAAAALFPLHAYPANDPRNAEVVRHPAYRFRVGEDFGFKDWFSHKDIDDYLCGPNRTLHFRVLMQQNRPVAADSSGSPMRKLFSFLTDPTAPQLQWPYLGLTNQGATCYISSYVQTLFYLPAFRRAVYNIPVDALQMLELIEPGGSSAAGGAAAAATGGSSLAVGSPSPAVVKTSIPLALQHLFFLLQTGRKAVDTRTLTKSFGWDSADSFQQHDVSHKVLEFSRVLLDALDESVVKQQPPMPAITRLFEGQQQMYIECQNVPYASTRVESFRGLSLSVKNAGTLQRSLDQYVAEELLVGSNRYRTVDKDKGIDFGLQDARKGTRILRFPQVLQIELQRFERTKKGATRKLDERFEFPTTLDLTHLEKGEEQEEKAAQAAPVDPTRPSDRHSSADPLDPPIYQLHSVLVHESTTSSGRHRVFIRPFLAAPAAAYDDSPWLQFDNENVSICADAREATEKQFGGEYAEVVRRLGTKMAEMTKSKGCACFLVYVRRRMASAKGFDPDQSLDADSPGPHAALHPSFRATALAESKEESEAREASQSVPMDFTDRSASPVAAAAIAASSASSSSFPLPGPVHRCWTSTPADLRAFIESLAPVAVSLPHHASAGLDEARRRAAELALQFRLDVVAERDLVWQGFNRGAGRGGVAGLGLTVAPAIDASGPQPLALRDFLFAAPHKQHAFKYLDTVGSVRARLAAEAGLPLERVQLWRVHRPASYGSAVSLRRQHCDLLGDHTRLFELPAAHPPGTAEPPLLLLRDRQAVDLDDSLVNLSHYAGAVGSGPSPLESHLQQERLLLFFKYFDVHSQRLVMLGSAVLWKAMSVQEVKQYLLALLRSRHIDLGARAREQLPAPTLVDRFDQLHRGQAPGAEMRSEEAVAGSMHEDADMSPADGSAALPFLAHMRRLGAGVALCPGSSAYSSEDDDIDEFDEFSHEEQRFARWLQARLDGIAAAPLNPADFVAPALQLVEEAECVAAAMDEARKVRVKDEALAKIQHLQKKTSTLSECGLINGSVIIMEPQASASELAQARSTHASACLRDGQRPAMDAASATATDSASLSSSPLSRAAAAADVDGSSGSANSVPFATAAASGPALLTSPLPSALLDPLPAHATFHPDARSYLKYLLHRWLVAFTPAVLDPVTMERAPLDPLASPLHPAASLDPAVMEVSTAWTLEQMRRRLAQRVSALVSPAVRASYPQVADAHCYKLWKPSRQFPGTIYVKDGDITRKILSGTPVTVAFALVGQATVDGLGPLEQLVRSQSTRSAVQTLYFELSAVSLRDLEDHWWLQVELVDERGEGHRLPSPYPGLWPEQPFLVPKGSDFSLGHLRGQIFRQFILAHRASLPFAHYALPGPHRLLASGDLANSVERFAPSAGGAARQPSAASAEGKKRAYATGQVDHPAAKKSKNDQASDASAPASGASAAAAGRVCLDADDLRMHVYAPDAAPAAVAPGNSSARSMAHFLLPWADRVCSVSQAALDQLRAFFERARADTPQGSHVRHPTIYSDKDLNAMQYTQPLPFRLTCHLQPTHSADGDQFDAFVFRFTTPQAAGAAAAAADGSLPPKQSYALSPLPPILAVGDRKDDSHGTAFRRRLAVQLGKPVEEVQLALLRPREYELIWDGPIGPPVSASSASAAMVSASHSPSPAVFGEWLHHHEDQRVLLGLHHDERFGTRHAFPRLPLPTSSQPVAAGCESASAAAGRVTMSDVEQPLDASGDELAQLRCRLRAAEAQAAAVSRAVVQRGAEATHQATALRIVHRQLAERHAELTRADAALQTAEQRSREEMEQQSAAHVAELHRQREQHESAAQQLRQSLKLKCGVCFESRPDVLYLPCRHVFCCGACDDRLPSRRCPKCNGAIAQTISGVFIEAE